MSSLSPFLRLPAELSGGVVGKWLALKDLAVLDSAVCHHASRKTLHENIFLSPLCILTSPTGNETIASEIILMWILAKKLRVEHVRIWGDTLSKQLLEYVVRFGQHIKHIALGNLQSHETIHEIIRHCPNVCTIQLHLLKISIEFVSLVRTFLQLENFAMCEVSFAEGALSSISGSLGDVPGHLLKLKNLQLNNDAEMNTQFLQVCLLEYIERLCLCEKYDLEWSRFTALRSVGFNSFAADSADTVAHVLAECPWIVNLDLTYQEMTSNLANALAHGPTNLRTLNIENASWRNSDLAAVTSYHKDSLEQLFLFDSDVSSTGTSQALSACTKLHTLSCTSLENVNISLMSKITTLGVGLGDEERVWLEVGMYCHRLQHLYLRQTMAYGDMDAIVSTLKVLPALQTLTLIGMLEFGRMRVVYDMEVYRPSVKVVVVEDEESVWYQLFQLPI